MIIKSFWDQLWIKDLKMSLMQQITTFHYMQIRVEKVYWGLQVLDDERVNSVYWDTLGERQWGRLKTKHNKLLLNLIMRVSIQYLYSSRFWCNWFSHQSDQSYFTLLTDVRHVFLDILNNVRYRTLLYLHKRQLKAGVDLLTAPWPERWRSGRQPDWNHHRVIGLEWPSRGAAELGDDMPR